MGFWDWVEDTIMSPDSATPRAMELPLYKKRFESSPTYTDIDSPTHMTPRGPAVAQTGPYSENWYYTPKPNAPPAHYMWQRNNLVWVDPVTQDTYYGGPARDFHRAGSRPYGGRYPGTIGGIGGFSRTYPHKAQDLQGGDLEEKNAFEGHTIPPLVARQRGLIPGDTGYQEALKQRDILEYYRKHPEEARLRQRYKSRQEAARNFLSSLKVLANPILNIFGSSGEDPIDGLARDNINRR